MSDNEGGHFWRMVLAAAAVAIAGCLALTRSFRTSKDGGRTWEGFPSGKDKPKPGRAKSPQKKQTN